MSLTQMQIIQSLGQAMEWFEKEITWGAPAGELKHLTGRIGELYVALMTNGSMAEKTNQPGYDVVSNKGERISVKTTTQMTNNGYVYFNLKTLNVVDRVVIIRINIEEMHVETLLDAPIEEAKELMATDKNQQTYIRIGNILGKKPKLNLSEIPVLRKVEYRELTIQEHENGSYQILENDKPFANTKDEFRKICKDLGLPILNSNNNPLNTRSLGSNIIKHLSE